MLDALDAIVKSINRSAINMNEDLLPSIDDITSSFPIRSEVDLWIVEERLNDEVTANQMVR